MKKIAVLFLSCLVFAASVQAQEAGFNNEALTATASSQGSSIKLSTDRFGQQIPQAISPFMSYGINDTAETGSTTTNIVATAHAVKVGDIVMFGVTSAARGGSSYVTSIATNSFTIAPPLRAAPSNGDFFYIGRPMPPAVDSNNGFLICTPKTVGGVTTAYVEEGTPANGDGGTPILGKVLATPATQTADGKYGNPMLNDLNAQYVDPVRRNAWSQTNPSIANASSVTLLASNAARRFLAIQNNSAANICVSLVSGTFTGIVPSNTNPCIVIAAGATFSTPPNSAPTSTITVYQTSGGAITSVSVVEAS